MIFMKFLLPLLQIISPLTFLGTQNLLCIIDIYYIQTRCIAKWIYHKKLKQFIIWNGESAPFENGFQWLSPRTLVLFIKKIFFLSLHQINQEPIKKISIFGSLLASVAWCRVEIRGNFCLSQFLTSPLLLFSILLCCGF